MCTTYYIIYIYIYIYIYMVTGKTLLGEAVKLNL